MPRRAVFFDRDNTLIINDGYLGDPARVVLMPHAAYAVAQATQLGFAVVTVSNQSGVARGMFDESAVKAVDQRMDELMLAVYPAAKIDLHVYCPFHPDAVVPAYRQESDLRKPAPGMILLAAKQLGLELSNSWMIGDAPRDVEAGKRAGCKTILFVPTAGSEPPALTASTIVADFTVTDLRDAVAAVRGYLTD